MFVGCFYSKSLSAIEKAESKPSRNQQQQKWEKKRSLHYDTTKHVIQVKYPQVHCHLK